MSYRVINGKIYSFGDFESQTINSKNRTIADNTKINSENSFESILKKEVQKKDNFVISNHAAERLKERNISLNESDMLRINEAINKAQTKGCNQSLILYKDVVLVASIKNRTIITAVDKDSSKGNVFTNIDSVVLI